ncbi:hypothetical protein O6P43_000356 [Quillaja saponaria]|uniref:Uncharacterized protein n=1 Tax=Quillaja saponaria TaxID=32244 RepID=A0AAD7QGE1_QUISA|nr:hypothetical protein O6P43_000356 [Quillaja saponaria]
MLHGDDKKEKNARKKRKLGLNDDEIREGRKKDKRIKSNWDHRGLSIETKIVGEQDVPLLTKGENGPGSNLGLESKKEKKK